MRKNKDGTCNGAAGIGTESSVDAGSVRKLHDLPDCRPEGGTGVRPARTLLLLVCHPMCRQHAAHRRG